jgi:phosphatidate phosphatase APP1
LARRDRLLKVAAEMERQLDRVKARLGRRAGPRDPLLIVPYRGYGTRKTLRLRARVLESRGSTATLDTDGPLRNLLNMARRFESDEVPGARVRAEAAGASALFTADEEGYVDVELDVDTPAGTVWHDVKLTLVHPAASTEVTAVGSVMVPPDTAGFGVISDLDDTVVQTNVGSLVRMARTVFLGNARTRVPFPGVSAFYRALQSDGTGGTFNPLFYVSSSPWNLYDLLQEFLMLARVPIGPMMLRDWGLSRDGLAPGGNRGHKLAAIRRILDTYPKLPFLLIGDSSEQDPEIYTEVVSLYPGRIPAVYIRNVSRDLERPEAIRALAARLVEAGSTLVLANDTVSAARHAIERGYIAATTLAEIETVKRIEEPEPTAPTPTVVVPATPAEAGAAPTIEKALEGGAADRPEPPTVVVER